MSRRERPPTSTPNSEPTGGPAATHASAGSPAGGADVTGLLIAWSEGDSAALDALLPVVYAELRRRARRALRREARGHALQPTALVHEAFLKLVDQRPSRWQGREQFFGVAARCMRQVLVDAARTRLAALDPDQARLVELRYFAGLTLDDTAATLGISPATVSREWTVARRWLRRELAPGRRP
jgi:DNA-directed RNA polymerase specialized sigma24 family protein